MKTDCSITQSSVDIYYHLTVAADQDNLIGINHPAYHPFPWCARLTNDLRQLEKRLQDPQYDYFLVGRITAAIMKPMLTKYHLLDKVITLSSTTNFPNLEKAEKFIQDNATNSTNRVTVLVLGGQEVYRSTLATGRVDILYYTNVNTRCPYPIDAKYISLFPLVVDQTRDYLTLIDEVDHQIVTRNIHYTIQKYLVNGKKLANAENLGCQVATKSITSNETSLSKRLDVAPLPQGLDIPTPIMNKPTKSSKWESSYANLVRRILVTGKDISSRNGSTRRLIGVQIRCNLEKEFPLLAGKQCYPKSIFTELMWFLLGRTDTNYLQQRGCKVWDAQSSAEWMKKNNLPWAAGEIGPGYGHQIRHFGAEYRGANADYTGQGTDQLASVIHLLRNSPTSRRIIINLWNPSCLEEMALPPCHMVYQWCVDPYSEEMIVKTGKKGRLSCHLFQRSWDIFLGWNPATAAMWTHLLAASCQLDVGELIHSISDVHIYHQHFTAAKEYLSRPTPPSPRLTVVPRDNIEEYQYTDLTFHEYYPYSAISVEMQA